MIYIRPKDVSWWIDRCIVIAERNLQHEYSSVFF